MVLLLCVTKMNCTRSDISRTMSQNRLTLWSSSGASTSSRMQNGAGLSSKIENTSATAVSLAGRPRHHCHSGRQHLFADQLQVSRAAPEQARELLLEARVDAVERVLETRSGLAIDLADRLVEGVERLGEVSELPIEVFLALGLLGQLLDGGKVDRAEPLDLSRDLGERRFPGGCTRLGRDLRPDVVELEPRGRELLEHRVAPQLGLLHREADLLEGLARGVDGRLVPEAFLLELTHPGIGLVQRPPRLGQFLLYRKPELQLALQRLLELGDRRFALGQLRLDLGASR